MEHFDAGIPSDGVTPEIEEELERVGLQRLKGKVLSPGIPRHSGSPAKDNVTLPNHYARFEIEPIYFIGQNQLNFFQGNVIKYILRHDAKNGIEDIKKAQRYARMYELYLSGHKDWAGIDPRVNALSKLFKELHAAVEGAFGLANYEDKAKLKKRLIQLEAEYAAAL